MNKQTEALKLAMEALENLPEMCGIEEAITAIREALAEQPAQQWTDETAKVPDHVWVTPKLRPLANMAHEQQELASASVEPVVWMYVNKSTHETKFQKHMRDFVDHSLWSEVPLYGEPLANHELQCVCGAVWLGDEMVHLPDKRPPAQQEPVAWKDRTYGNLHHQDFGNSIPLYASPPIEATPLASQRSVKPWVGLTDEQINEFFQGMEPNNGFWLSFARAIEAKLKEKNT